MSLALVAALGLLTMSLASMSSVRSSSRARSEDASSTKGVFWIVTIAGTGTGSSGKMRLPSRQMLLLSASSLARGVSDRRRANARFMTDDDLD